MGSHACYELNIAIKDIYAIAKHSFCNTSNKREVMHGYHIYKSCIEACMNCAAICHHCAAACLQEDNVQMMKDCVKMDMECAAICIATAQILSMDGSQAKAMAMICAEICDACSIECAKHDNQHCRECSDVCHNCANQCRTILTESIHVNR